MIKAMLKRSKSACWLNIATLFTGFAAFEVYRSLSFADAEYQGEKLLYYFSKIAPFIIWSVVAWEFACIIGPRRWKGIGVWIQKSWKKVTQFFKACSVRSKRIVLCVSVIITAAVCIGVFNYINECDTKYYEDVMEFYGIPNGIGDAISPEELGGRAGYWRIDDYPRRHCMVLTYVDAYGQMELMRQYSSVYGMMFFQLPARIEYRYKENERKFHSYGQEYYDNAKEHGFREPVKVTYYASNGKVLLELSGDGYEKLKIDTYSSEETPQLLYSTLLRFPDGQTAENGVVSWQIESSYDSNGMPVMRKLDGGVCNLYGINGERYTYDFYNRLESICYLDVNGMPACNKQGILMITFQHDEDGGCEISYYSDENGTERTEGFYGVYCEEIKYDSYGNIKERRQKDKQGRWCCDVNGVYKYIYEYENGRLISEAYYGVDEQPVRNNQLDSQSVGFSLEKEGETEKIGVILDYEESFLTSRSVSEITPFLNNFLAKAVFYSNIDTITKENTVWTELPESQTQKMSSVNESSNLLYDINDKESGQTNDQEKNTVWTELSKAQTQNVSSVNESDNLLYDINDKGNGQTNDQEKTRNYTSIQNIITRDSLVIKYCDDSGANIKNEWGYAAKKISYDERMRVTEEAYMDLDDELCLIEDGYAVIKTSYRSTTDDRIERIEYMGISGKDRAMNKNEGYSYVCFQYSRQGESEVITSAYYDPLENPIYLPKLGYAAVSCSYNKNGFLIQETYRDINGVITYRNDYRVAEILYEYANDGNLSRVWYKDVEEKPTNRLDTGYAVVYQEYESGQLVRRHYEGYRNQMLCAVSDKTTGICDTVYYYTKGREQQEQYFDAEGCPTLRSDIGCAAISYEYDNNGNISVKQYYGMDGELILRKDTGYAVEECEYNDEEQCKIFRYFGVDKQPIINRENHCAGIKEIYDGDKLIEIQYLDLDGSLMNRSDYGYARVCKTYDDAGNLKTEAYFDAEGNHATRKDYGYAMYENFFDEVGMLRECRYYNFSGGQRKLVMRKDTGYAIVRYEYDGSGNSNSQTYFDTEEQPVISTKYHCAGFLSEYDNYGNEIVTWYIDLDGNPLNRDDYGLAQVSREYDPKSGNLLSEFYYDTKGSPTIRKEYGYASYKRSYDERGNLVETRYYDIKGELTLREDTGYAIYHREYNEYGELGAEYFYGEDERPVISTEYHCAGFLYTYDKKGKLTQTSYLGIDGKPAVRSDCGCAYTCNQYDAAGRLIWEAYFGTDGKTVIRKDCGYASYENIYEEGRMAERRYYGLQEELVPNKETGYALEKCYYDEYGYRVLDLFYGVDEKPVISSKYQCAGIKSVYDKMGNNTEIWYLSFDGELMNRGDYGCAKICQEYDGSGNIVKASYFDAKGQPVIRKDYGYASYEDIYDEKTGRWREERYLNTQGDLTLRKDHGYAVMKVEYDSYGREKIYTYYGTDEQPIISCYYYCAGMEYFYDEKGNRTRIQYLSQDGNSLMTRLDFGCAQVVQKYSASGRLTGEDYLDLEGQPAVQQKYGYASYEDIYAKNGKLIESRYYGLDGELVLRKDMGYAVVKYSYNEYGQVNSSYFFGVNEKPVISTNYHCAGITYSYENGNRTEIWYHGLDGQLINRSDYGCAQIRKEYDEFGFITKESYIDTDGQVVIRKDIGYAICKERYDPYHRRVEFIYCDTQGHPMLEQKSGTAMWKLDYDKYGREARYTYFSTDEKPILNNIYSCYGIRYSYDEQGNQTEIQYLDPDGEMMLRSDWGCAQIKKEYNGLGQLVKYSYCNVDGQPVIMPKYGYAAYTIEYEKGIEKEYQYLDIEDNPIVRKDTGYAMLRYTYNELGQCIWESYLDADGQLVSVEGGYAMLKYKYDERGNCTYIWYYGLDGKVFVHEDYGAMLNYKIYDEYDRIKWDKYYIYDYDNLEYQQVVRKDEKYSAIQYIYNEQGQVELKKYLDVDGKLVMHTEDEEYRYAECWWIYNEMGQLERVRYYDADEELVNLSKGYAEIEYIYDASGNNVDWKFYDKFGNEVELK
ncbi:MAG: hypothetical protein HDR12_03970 [Lachnospiraceae bacterium]|nr:hypothetical protein [Lachnospiraceae bacterium]